MIIPAKLLLADVAWTAGTIVEPQQMLNDNWEPKKTKRLCNNHVVHSMSVMASSDESREEEPIPIPHWQKVLVWSNHLLRASLKLDVTK